MLNKIYETGLINLYTLSKQEKKIQLKFFDFKCKEHLTLLNIANNLHSLYGFEIYLEANLKDFLLYKLKTKHTKHIHWKKSILIGVDIEDFLTHICSAYGETREVWEKIYVDFFEEKGEDE